MHAIPLFPRRSSFRAVFALLLALVRPAEARAEPARVPPPRAELDAGPPPLPRAPEHARKPFALVAELGSSLPTCKGGPGSSACRALAPAYGAGLSVIHRPVPYFAFGGAFAYARARGVGAAGPLAGELLAGGAVGRVHLYEEGGFDPYLELELGYGRLRTTLQPASSERHDQLAFGPMARVAGGFDFVVSPALVLGGAVGFRHLVIERGSECARGSCRSGGPPGGAMLGALVFGLRATLVLGSRL